MHGLQGPAKKKPTPLNEPKSTLLLPSYKKPSTQPGESYTQITSQNLPTTPIPAPAPPANQPQQQSNGISELTALVKNLFDQMGTLLNLLTTVLTNLK
jgi:hypothetical protein